MDQTSITAAGVIDTFLVLLIGVGPKIALVPFLETTASLDKAAKQRVLRKMMTTAATVAVLLMVLGELLRALLHFTIGPCRLRRPGSYGIRRSAGLRGHPPLFRRTARMAAMGTGVPRGWRTRTMSRGAVCDA